MAEVLWTIVARKLPIGQGLPFVENVLGVAGHLYLDVLDHNGRLVAAINGLATSRTESGLGGKPVTYMVGMPWHSIQAHIDARYWPRRAEHESMVIASAPRSQVEKALQYMETAKNSIENADNNYFLLGAPSYNSNSVFSGMLEAIDRVIPLSKTTKDAAKSLGGINPGSERDIFEGQDFTKEGLAPLKPWISVADPTANEVFLTEKFDQPAGSIILDRRTLADGKVSLTLGLNDGSVLIQKGTFTGTTLNIVTQTQIFDNNDASVVKTYNKNAAGQFQDPIINITLKDQLITGEQIGTVFGSVLADQLANGNMFVDIALDTVLNTLKPIEIAGGDVLVKYLKNPYKTVSNVLIICNDNEPNIVRVA